MFFKQPNLTLNTATRTSKPVMQALKEFGGDMGFGYNPPTEYEYKKEIGKDYAQGHEEVRTCRLEYRCLARTQPKVSLTFLEQRLKNKDTKKVNRCKSPSLVIYPTVTFSIKIPVKGARWLAPSIRLQTLFVYKRRLFGTLCCPHHVNTSMKKVVNLLLKTPKNLYGKRKKHVHWVIVMMKSLLHLSCHCHNHPTKKSCS